MTTDTVKCNFCGSTVESLDQAAASGWTPYFYIGMIERGSPVCPTCSTEYLAMSEVDGEMELTEAGELKLADRLAGRTL